MKTISILAALALALGAGAGDAGAMAEALNWEPYLVEGPDGATAAGEIATLMVPEVRGRNGTRAIPLRFVRLPSTSDAPGNPIVYLAGGPGGSAVGNARTDRFAFFQRLREAGDVILLEQRGTGLSNELPPCPVQPIDPARPLDRANFADGYRRELARCILFWRSEGVGVEGYNSVESAADLEALRTALGVERLDLVALSYGTHLAMEALKQRLPVGRVVLAGLEGPDQTVKLPEAFDAFLARVAQAVRSDPAAAAAYPDLLAMMRRVHRRLDLAPVDVIVTGRDGGRRAIRLGAFAVQLVTGYLFISDPERLARLPSFYRKMDEGDFQAAGEAAVRLVDGFLTNMDGMPQLMDLSSGISPERLARVEAGARTAVLGDAGNFPMPQVRNVAPDLVLPPSYREPLATDARVLLVMGTMDGRTPIESQEELLDSFQHPARLTVVNGGHNIFEQSEAVQRQIVDFLREGRIGAERIVLAPPRFDLPTAH